MKLSELKAQIDAGETVITDVYGSYCAVFKEKGKKRIYIYCYDNEQTRYNGFNALIKDRAWDEEEGDEGRWEVEPPLTEEQQAIADEVIEVAKQENPRAAARLLVRLTTADYIRNMERELFTTRDEGTKTKNLYLIQFMRGRLKEMESETSA